MVNKSKAFTLIELAIVLVIIGIIIGGITAGVALAKQAQIRGVIRDIQEIQTAINSFKVKFDFLPGDFPDAGAIWSSIASCPNSAASAGCNGNANGLIDSAETYRAWQHLNLANMIKGSYTGVAGSGAYGGVNVMSMTYNGSIYNIRSTGAGLYKLPSQLNTINLLRENSAEGAFTAEDSYAIDVKIDDGAPTTGKYIAGRGNSVSGVSTCVTAWITSNAAGISYIINDPLPNCRGWYLIN